ncbi:MAG: acyl-CoA dehydrogenase family protein [Myxococcota bacterium]|nr:acyl-CoA dehydrogenase family protein [Myxococcota bacterium]
MDFGFSDEQELLRAEARKFLDQNASLEVVRKISETDEGVDRALWNRMAELGWVGLTMPEEHGGMGLDLVTLIVLLEETGRSLFPSPLISTVLAARAIEHAGSEAQKERWLPGLADGSKIGAFAYLEDTDRHDAEGLALLGERDGDATLLSGAKQLVGDTASADLFVVAYRSGSEADRVSLAVVERGAAGLEIDDFPTMDQTKRVGRLRLDAVRVGDDSRLGADGSAGVLFSKLLDIGALFVAAEAVGAAEGAVALTRDFANERIQFGEPIGRFQGVKHPLAEAHVDVESFKSLVYYAAWALEEGADDAPRAVSRAKAYASEAFPRIGIEGVQLHGAVGYTEEYDIQLYLKRSKWMRPAFGDADHHYDRLATIALNA